MAYVKLLLKQLKCLIDSTSIDINTKQERLEHMRNVIEREIDLRRWNEESSESRTVGKANLCDFSALQFPNSEVKRANNRVPVR